MRLSALGALSLAIASMAAVSGCNSCEAKCVGPTVEVEVGSGVSRVSICDADGRCTTQSFTPSTPEPLYKSFAVVAVERDGHLPVKVDAETVDGQHIGPTTLKPKPTKGECGCTGPGLIHVGTDGASLFDG